MGRYRGMTGRPNHPRNQHTVQSYYHSTEFPGDAAYYLNYTAVAAATAPAPALDGGPPAPTLAPSGAPPPPPPLFAATYTPTYYTPSYFRYDNKAIKEMVKKQIEYYFSDGNLIKDVFLRQKMDKDGYVPLSAIASFHRVQSLTQDMDVIINACRDSELIDISTDTKIRPKNDPLKWPFPESMQQSTNGTLDPHASPFVPGQTYATAVTKGPTPPAGTSKNFTASSTATNHHVSSITNNASDNNSSTITKKTSSIRSTNSHGSDSASGGGLNSSNYHNSLTNGHSTNAISDSVPSKPVEENDVSPTENKESEWKEVASRRRDRPSQELDTLSCRDSELNETSTDTKIRPKNEPNNKRLTQESLQQSANGTLEPNASPFVTGQTYATAVTKGPSHAAGSNNKNITASSSTNTACSTPVNNTSNSSNKKTSSIRSTNSHCSDSASGGSLTSSTYHNNLTNGHSTSHQCNNVNNTKLPSKPAEENGVSPTESKESEWKEVRSRRRPMKKNS